MLDILARTYVYVVYQIQMLIRWKSTFSFSFSWSNLVNSKHKMEVLSLVFSLV